MEQFLRNHSIDATLSTYLDSQQNDDTDMVNDTIPEVIKNFNQNIVVSLTKS